jgi:LPS sulfotransferase NodH
MSPSTYLLCANPRTGSWLLCHALEQTGVAGIPAEYFWRGDMPFWRKRWGLDDDVSFLDYVHAFRTKTATPNAVIGTKMMWGYFGDFLEEAPIEALGDDIGYLWLRRRDKVRQGISWWRATVTGAWARNAGTQQPEPVPDEIDHVAVRNLVEVSHVHEQRWAEHFALHGIEPWVVDYEDLVQDLDGHTRAALAHLGLAPPPAWKGSTPRLERQADEHTERWIAQYLANEG